MFMCKITIGHILPPDVQAAREEYEIAEHYKQTKLQKWGIVENEKEDPTPWDR